MQEINTPSYSAEGTGGKERELSVLFLNPQFNVQPL